MDIFKWLRWMVWLRHTDLECDTVFDQQIRRALAEYENAQPSACAWERLIRTITERGLIRGYGMWVLDEPLRDPPELLPMSLTGVQYQHAERLYKDRYGSAMYRARDAMMNPWLPTFPVLVNL